MTTPDADPATCPECQPDLFRGTVWHPMTYHDMLCAEHRPPEPEWMTRLRAEQADVEAAFTDGRADLPVHPSRVCVDHSLAYMAMPDNRCGICGWPTTHMNPAAVLTGIVNASLQP